MSEKTEKITIQKCPKCASRHTYQLITGHTIVMLLADNEGEVKVKTITHLFKCPTTGGTFQAKLNLRIASGEKITSVESHPVEKGV